MTIRYLPRRMATLVAAAALAWSSWAGAQAWPARTIKLVVPFPAGGATDVLTRTFAQTLQTDLGQSVIVENKPGAAGAIGSAQVEKSPPDGYTLLLGTSSTHSIAPYLTKNLAYDAFGGFTPISMLAEGASVLVASPQLPFTNVGQVIAFAKANPGKLTYGSSGVGSIPHLTAAYFAGTAGIQLQHVPYTGSSLAYPDMKAGRVDLMADAIITALPQVRAGTVRGLAITSAHRSALAPEIPTLAESGLTGFQSTVWFGLFGPKNLPPAIAKALSDAAIKALNTRELKSRYADLGVEAVPSTPAEFDKVLARESAKWKKVITDFEVVSQ